MSKEVNQFLGIVRNQKPTFKYFLYCWRCGRETPHILHERGDWEEYTCQNITVDDDGVENVCSETQTFRVR